MTVRWLQERLGDSVPKHSTVSLWTCTALYPPCYKGKSWVIVLSMKITPLAKLSTRWLHLRIGECGLHQFPEMSQLVISLVFLLKWCPLAQSDTLLTQPQASHVHGCYTGENCGIPTGAQCSRAGVPKRKKAKHLSTDPTVKQGAETITPVKAHGSKGSGKMFSIFWEGCGLHAGNSICSWKAPTIHALFCSFKKNNENTAKYNRVCPEAAEKGQLCRQHGGHWRGLHLFESLSSWMSSTYFLQPALPHS